MGRPKKKQAATYRRFVEAGIRDIDAAFIDTKRHSRFCIGSDDRQKRADDMYLDMVQKHDTKEDVSFRRIGHYASVEEVLATCQNVLDVSRECLNRRAKNSTIRPAVGFALCHYAGCTQREAAEVLGLSSGAAVSIQLKTDKALQATLEQLKHSLASKGS